MSAYVPGRVSDRRWDDPSQRLGVFVAGLMGAGALMSVIVGLAESIGSARGRARLARRAEPTAHMLAAGVLDGFDRVATGPTGIRPRRHHVVVAAGVGVAGAAITARSAWLYATGDIGVVTWALTVSSGVLLLVAAGFFAVAAVRWPRVPAVIRRLDPARPENPRGILATIPHTARVAIAIMVALVVLGGVLVVFAPSWMAAVDQPLYDHVLHAGRHAHRFTPSWFNQFGYAPFLVGMPTVVFLITFVRCRAVAIAYPIMIAAGGLVFLGLNWTVHRARPPQSVRAGQFTSYPGGHSIQVTLVLLALPLVVWVLTTNRVVRVVGTVVPVGVWAAEFVDNVRIGAHWPTDQLAGALIAACGLIVVYSVGLDALARRDGPPRAGTPAGPLTR